MKRTSLYMLIFLIVSYRLDWLVISMSSLNHFSPAQIERGKEVIMEDITALIGGEVIDE